MRILPSDLVLEIGSGNSPHSRSNVLCDKYIESDVERAGGMVSDRVVVCGDGERLPFKDKSFDYIIAKQVVEHFDNPVASFKEMMRVSRRGGHIETPTEYQERINPEKTFHKWLISLTDGKLCLKPKRPEDYFRIGGIIKYLYHNDRDFQTFYFNHLDLFIVRYEWEKEIKYEILPADSRFILDLEDDAVCEKILKTTPRKSWRRFIPPVVKRVLLPLYSRKIRAKSGTKIDLQKLIACPLCKGDINPVSSNGYSCPTCKKIYPIRNGIIRLLVEEATEQ